MIFNKTNKFFLYFFLIGSTLIGLEKEDLLYMTKDYEKGVEIARSYSLPLVVVFSGGEWCFYSKKLEEKILSKQEFIHEVNKKFVFIQVDFPDIPISLRSKIVAQNFLLKEEFHVRDFPAVVLLNSELEEVCRIGYTEEIPCEYAKRLLSAWNKYDVLSQQLTNASQLSFEKIQDLYQECKELGSLALAKKFIEAGLKIDKDFFFHIAAYQSFQGDDKKKIKEKMLGSSLDKGELAVRIGLIDLADKKPEERECEISNLFSLIENLKKTGVDCSKISAHLDAWAQIGKQD